MLIDTHAHLNFRAFDKDRDGVIKRSLAEDVWLINASSNYKTSKLAVELAEKYPRGIFASVGLHPINCVIDLSQADEDRLEELNIEKYRELAKSKGVVAIGEIGLDYWNEPKGKEKARIFKEKQKEVFLKQLDLAKELNLPVIFHCRKAHDDLINLLVEFLSSLNSCDRKNKEMGVLGNSWSSWGVEGVVHCFIGTWQQAEKFLEMGLYIGFNGIIFKFDVDEVIKKTPLDRMLIETDCPFLTPPALGEQRNEPLYVKYVAQKIAEIRNEPLEKISQATTQNAKKLFNFS